MSNTKFSVSGTDRVFHKCVLSSVNQYVLSTNPRNGAVVKTYFPPTTYELKKHHEYLRRELFRKTQHLPPRQKRELKSLIPPEYDKMDNLPPLKKLTSFFGNNGQMALIPRSREYLKPHPPLPSTRESMKTQPEKEVPLGKVLRAFRYHRTQSEMEQRWQAETEYANKVRLNKRMSEVMTHRVDRFYYLQGGQLPLAHKTKDAEDNDKQLLPIKGAASGKQLSRRSRPIDSGTMTVLPSMSTYTYNDSVSTVEPVQSTFLTQPMPEEVGSQVVSGTSVQLQRTREELETTRERDGESDAGDHIESASEGDQWRTQVLLEESTVVGNTCSSPDLTPTQPGGSPEPSVDAEEIQHNDDQGQHNPEQGQAEDPESLNSQGKVETPEKQGQLGIPENQGQGERLENQVQAELPESKGQVESPENQVQGETTENEGQSKTENEGQSETPEKEGQSETLENKDQSETPENLE